MDIEPNQLRDLIDGTLRELGQLAMDGLEAGKLTRVRDLMSKATPSPFAFGGYEWKHVEWSWSVTRQAAADAYLESASGLLELIVGKRDEAFVSLCQKLDGRLARESRETVPCGELTETVCTHASHLGVVSVYLDFTYGVKREAAIQ